MANGRNYGAPFGFMNNPMFQAGMFGLMGASPAQQMQHLARGQALQHQQAYDQERLNLARQRLNNRSDWQISKAGSNIYRVNPRTGETELLQQAPVNPIAGQIAQIMGGAQPQQTAPYTAQPPATTAAPAPVGGGSFEMEPAPQAPLRIPGAAPSQQPPPVRRMDFGVRPDARANARRGMRGQTLEDGTFIPEMKSSPAVSPYQRAGALVASQPGMGRAGTIMANVGSENRKAIIRRGEKILQRGAENAEKAQKVLSDIEILQRGLDMYNKQGVSFFGTGPYFDLEQAGRAYLEPFIGDEAGALASGDLIRELTSRLALQARDTSTGAGMPGAMSDADRRFLTKIPAGAFSSAAGNVLRNDILRRKAEREIEMQVYREEWARRNNGSMDGFAKWARDYNKANPMFADLQMPTGSGARVGARSAAQGVMGEMTDDAIARELGIK